MKEDTTEIKGETVKKAVTQDKLEKRVTRLEALMRKAGKVMEQHFGVDIDKDGKIGSVRVAMLVVLLFSTILMAATSIVDWGTGVSGTIGTANITSDGTSATFQVDKISVKSGLVVTGGQTIVSGGQTITAGGQTITAGGQTITAGGQTVTAGDVYLVAGTVRVDRINANTNGLTGMPIAGLSKDYFEFFDDFFYTVSNTNATESTALLNKWKYAGDTGASSTIVTRAGVGGILSLNAGLTANDEAYIQLGPQGTEAMYSIATNSGKKLWFETRVGGQFKGGTNGFFVGLADAGAAAANFLADTELDPSANINCIGFLTAQNDTNRQWNFVYNVAAGGKTNLRIGATAAIGSYTRLGFYFDGVNKMYHYVDGVQASRIYTNDVIDEYPDGTNMSPIIASKTGTALFSPSNNTDYIRIIMER